MSQAADLIQKQLVRSGDAVVLVGEDRQLEPANSPIARHVRKAQGRVTDLYGPGHGAIRPDGDRVDPVTGEVSSPRPEPEPTSTPDPGPRDEPAEDKLTEAQRLIRQFTRQLRSVLAS